MVNTTRKCTKDPLPSNMQVNKQNIYSQSPPVGSLQHSRRARIQFVYMYMAAAPAVGSPRNVLESSIGRHITTKTKKSKRGRYGKESSRSLLFQCLFLKQEDEDRVRDQSYQTQHHLNELVPRDGEFLYQNVHYSHVDESARGECRENGSRKCAAST
jgi:hypothetical protein